MQQRPLYQSRVIHLQTQAPCNPNAQESHRNTMLTDTDISMLHEPDGLRKPSVLTEIPDLSSNSHSVRFSSSHLMISVSF